MSNMRLSVVVLCYCLHVCCTYDDADADDDNDGDDDADEDEAEDDDVTSYPPRRSTSQTPQ